MDTFGFCCCLVGVIVTFFIVSWLRYLDDAFHEERALSRKTRERLTTMDKDNDEVIPTIMEVRALQYRVSCLNLKFTQKDANISFKLDNTSNYIATLYSNEEKKDISETRFILLIKNRHNKKWITFAIDSSGNINFNYDYSMLPDEPPIEDMMKFKDIQEVIGAIGLFSITINPGRV